MLITADITVKHSRFFINHQLSLKNKYFIKNRKNE